MDRQRDAPQPSAALPAAATPAEEAPFAASPENGTAGNCEGLGPLSPPLPLPPLAFREPERPEVVDSVPPPAPMPPRVFLRSGPAFANSATRQADSLHPRVATTEPLSAIESVFSEIDAEASTRSLTAVEADTAGPSTVGDLLPKRAALATAPPDLGSLVPGAPRLEMPRQHGASTFKSFVPEPRVRPDVLPVSPEYRLDRQARYGLLARRLIRIVAWALVGWFAVVLALMIVYRFVDPPASTLMLQRWLAGQKVTQMWVPIEQMSPNIIRAVIASEDGRFCEHHGVDFGALQEAVEEVGTRSARGASTISMQVVKNLFLWTSKSYVRKAIELPLTFIMELIWPKRRIMEVYLNIAEWGPGIFGIEAASQFRFHKSARTLSAGQASRLAVALPNPITRNPARPGPGLQRLARVVQFRMRITPYSRTSCVLPRRRP
jgi:monofunctional biosynthetic peptidoglycan transglycosylase